MGQGDTWINAFVGAAITLGLSFTGFSPLLGGGIAGYLQDEPPNRGGLVGAISGLLATIPLLFIVFMGIALFSVGPAMGGFGILFLLFFMTPLFLIWFVGLSAAGGYLGAYIRQDRDVA